MATNKHYTAGSSKVEMSKKHADLLRGIRIWMEGHPHTTPLELAVFDEIVERVTVQARSGAFVRVRIKNRGRPRGKRPFAPPLPLPVQAVVGEEKRERGKNVPWTVEELDRLESLYRDMFTLEDIGEMMSRSRSSVSAQVTRMRLRRVQPKGKTGIFHKNNAVIAAAHRVAERRKAEMAEYAVEYAAD